LLDFEKIELLFFFFILSLHKQLERKPMFCKVCFDASNNGFNTHNVRDGAGNVLCPILLTTKCRTCGYFGHTTKYCKSTKHIVKQSAKQTVCEVVPVFTIPPSNPTNKFAMLNCYESDDDRDSYPSDDGVMDFENDPIIWGVGLQSMIGKRWADVLGY